MGSRAQVKIEDTGVFLYTHWGADELAEEVRETLSKRWRWQDPEYLARIIFSGMIRGQEGGETGFGIGTSQHGDIEVLVTLNCQKQTVKVERIYEKELSEFTFSEFINQGE